MSTTERSLKWTEMNRLRCCNSSDICSSNSRITLLAPCLEHSSRNRPLKLLLLVAMEV